MFSEARLLGLKAASVLYEQCHLEQVMLFLIASVFSAVKWVNFWYISSFVRKIKLVGICKAHATVFITLQTKV